MNAPPAKIQAPHEVSAGAGGGAFIFGCALLAVALASTANETFIYLAKTRSYSAQRAAKRGDDSAALDLTRSSLRLDPHNTQALYLRGVRLRARNDEPGLDAILPLALAIHPNQASVRRLAGDTAYRRAENASAAETLWRSLWINPLPPASPASYWRMALVTSARSGLPGGVAARLASAIRAADLADHDPTLPPPEQGALYIDAAAELGAQGAPLTAGHLKALAERKP